MNVAEQLRRRRGHLRVLREHAGPVFVRFPPALPEDPVEALSALFERGRRAFRF